VSDTEVSEKKRIVIVSNRLPFTVKQEEGGSLRFVPSVGGLATGLSSYLELLRDHPQHFQDCLWVGWPGSTISEDRRNEVRARSLAEWNAVPVFLSEEEIDNFYQGFCNKTIWPLFHYFQVYTNYEDAHWDHYLEVNRTFCRVLMERIRPQDTIWIQDYHFMLLPAMIRELCPDASIGFFLHIPFPSYEIFRLLPSRWRREILKGLLGADLIGFHTNDYRQDFLRCVLRILGCDSNMGEITVGDRVVKAESFPMGIDYRKYHDGAKDALILQEARELQRQLGHAKIILSIDRLDYTKGIVNRLEGFQHFLEAHPSWRGKVVLLMVVVPSRVDVEHYEMMKNQIEALVGKINGLYGSPDWTPIIYMFRTLTFAPLIAMYAAAHVALITPLRDGMNLIAKEYVASRVDKTGVLILSEMAGASKELLEAVLTNPNNRSEIAEAIFDALQMPEEEQIRRNAVMQQRIRRYDVVRWAADFIEELGRANLASRRFSTKMLQASARSAILERYHTSTRRLILLDYDGTLVPFAPLPHHAVPDPPLLRTLRDLSLSPCNDVVIISGRDRNFLEQWFAPLGISLVAEHGAWIRESGRDWQPATSAVIDWQPKLKPLLERYVDRVAGSFIEEKDFALVWHYRGADLEPGKLAAQELKDHLLALTANIDVHILQGNKTIEARVAGVNKGTAGVHFLNKKSYDFILCIGDDTTDEDLFAVLPETAFSIRVGISGTSARYTVGNVKDVLRLLDEIALSENRTIQPA